MKIEIPSPVLIRLQIMFNSGMTLQEVTEALELDLVDETSDAVPELAAVHPVETSEKIELQTQETPPAVLEDGVENVVALGEDAVPAEAVDYLFGLTSAVQDLGSDVYALAGHAKVQNSKSLSKISQNLISSMQTVAKLVNAVNRYVPAADSEEMGPAVATERWVVPSPTEQRSSSPPSNADIKSKSLPPIPQGVRPGRDPKDERRLKVPQPRKVTMPAPSVAPPTPGPTVTPSNRKTDPQVRKAAPAMGADFQSRITSTLDQIEEASGKQDGAKRSG